MELSYGGPGIFRFVCLFYLSRTVADVRNCSTVRPALNRMIDRGYLLDTCVCISLFFSHTILHFSEADFQEAGEDFVEDSDYRENQQTRLPPESYARARATTGQI